MHKPLSCSLFELGRAKSLTIVILLLSLLPQSALSKSTPHEAKPIWEEISQTDGITVWKQEIPGTSLVGFRGKGIIDADLHAVFSVLYESEHKKELLYRCTEYRILEVQSKINFVIYNRIASPFILISDRDAVVRTDMVFDPANKTIIAKFKDAVHKDQPPVDGAVRMVHLEGMWILKAQKNGKTLVTYEVQADPGGLLPKWVVNIANRSLPTKTIQSMRREVKRLKVYGPSRQLTVRFFDLEPFLGADHPAIANRPKEPLTEAQTQALIDAVQQGLPLPIPQTQVSSPLEIETGETKN